MSEKLQVVLSQKSVSDTIDALETAVQNAGAKIIARVDHAKGAKSVDMELGEAQLLIFGNPMIGTKAMQADIRAGLFLPLKVLAYQNGEGKTVLSYVDPSDMFASLDIAKDAEFIQKMQGALGALTKAAAE